MTTEARIIKQITNGGATADGLVITFDFITTKDERVTLRTEASNIGRLVAYLVGLGVHAAKKRPTMHRPDRVRWEGEPIPVEDIGIAPGKTAGEKVLVFYLGEATIGFSLPARAYSSLFDMARKVDDDFSPSSGDQSH